MRRWRAVCKTRACAHPAPHNAAGRPGSGAPGRVRPPWQRPQHLTTKRNLLCFVWGDCSCHHQHHMNQLVRISSISAVLNLCAWQTLRDTHSNAKLAAAARRRALVRSQCKVDFCMFWTGHAAFATHEQAWRGGPLSLRIHCGCAEEGGR